MHALDQLAVSMEQNREVLAAYSRYLNYHPRILDADMVDGLVRECGVDRHEAYLALFAAVLGWEPDENPTHRALERHYLRPGLHRLDPTVYQNDPYCRAVRFPNVKNGAWELRESSYAPFEPFVCNHPVTTPEWRQIPQIGYFTEEFRFPAVLENGIEWMTVTPNEIETMRAPIAHAHGRVLTLGLGLGYFAFSAAQKADVERVTVIERDRRVIELFHTHLLPQFPHREKIRVIEGDAIAFVEHCDADSFDTLFADLWHDQGDGLELYMRLRGIEKRRALPCVDYWIEPTLLWSLRDMVWDMLQSGNAPRPAHTDPLSLLTDAALRDLAADLKRLR